MRAREGGTAAAHNHSSSRKAVEDIVRQHLEESEDKMTLLPENQMNRALEYFVKKNNAHVGTPIPSHCHASGAACRHRAT